MLTGCPDLVAPILVKLSRPVGRITGVGYLGGLVRWKLVWAGQARPYMCVRFWKGADDD